MKSTTSVLLGAAAAMAATGAAALEIVDLRSVSYNIRYASTNPSGLENPWSTRLPLMEAQLHHMTAGHDNTLLCFQEVLYQQVVDLGSALGDEWEYVGIGRDDGVREGEFSPIFYQPSEWELLENKTYWLSETPDVVGSVGWDAALPRIANVAKFKHRSTGKPVVQMCTHFDHLGVVAREKSAELVVDISREWAETEHLMPVFLGGDFNSRPDSKGYHYLSQNMNDVRYIVPANRRHGHKNTFNGFDEDDSNNHQIDFIFINHASNLEWLSFAVLETRFDDGIIISDHRPVVVDARMYVS